MEGASPAAPTHPRAGDGLLKVRFPPIPPLKPTGEGRRDSGCQKRRRNPGSSGRRIALPTVDWACSDPSLGAHRPPRAHWSPELDGGCSHEVSHTERMCSVSLVPSCTAVGEIGTSQAEATGSRFGLSIRNFSRGSFQRRARQGGRQAASHLRPVCPECCSSQVMRAVWVGDTPASLPFV